MIMFTKQYILPGEKINDPVMFKLLIIIISQDQSCTRMKTYKDGPVSLQERSCTDKICLFLFFLFSVVMLCIGIFAWSQGNFKRLTKAYDPDGKGCGVDYPDYPYIYFASPSIDSLWVTVCVSECPKAGDSSLKCQTNSVVNTCNAKISQNTSQIVQIYDSTVSLNTVCLPTSKVLSDSVSSGLGSSAAGISSVFQYYELILFAFPIAILMAIAVMILVRFTACCFVYILIFLAIGGLMGLGAYLLTQKSTLASSFIQNDKIRMVVAILLIALGVIVFILMCCLRNRISLASKIVEVAAIFVAKNCIVVFLPLLLFVITVLFMALWIVQGLGYYSLGQPTSSERHYPFQNFELTKPIYILLSVHVLYLFWVIFFFIDTSGFLISGTAASWYYSRQSPYGQTSERYRSKHMGSVCAGSFFKALLAFIKFMYEILTPQVQADGDGWKSKIKKCCDCICCLCMKLFDWLNGGAYTVVNITGDDYCSGAMKGVEVRIKNIAVTGIITILQAVFSIIIRLGITALTVLIIEIIISSVQKYKAIEDRTFILIVVGLIGFAISCFFTSVYSDSVQALLVTYLLDIESGGSKSNAPEGLRSFLQEARKDEHIVST